MYIKNKIKGCLWGQAIGDALGLGAEFLTKKEVAQHYPLGLTAYHQIIQDAHRKRWFIGDWTDDTEQALCIIDSILDINEVDALDFAQKLYAWFAHKPMGIGDTVLKVVSMPQFTLFPHKAAELVWRISKYRNASNGAIMRCSPLGLWHFWSLEKVQKQTETICKVTHADPRCVGSCVIVTYLISQTIKSDKEIDFDTLVAIGTEYSPLIAIYLHLAKSSPDISELRLDDKSDWGYTLKTLSAAVWAYYHATSFEQGIWSIIAQGGDADSNAAVAGSILGAKFGFNAINSHLVLELHQRERLGGKIEKFMTLIFAKYAQL